MPHTNFVFYRTVVLHAETQVSEGIGDVFGRGILCSLLCLFVLGFNLTHFRKNSKMPTAHIESEIILYLFNQHYLHHIFTAKATTWTKSGKSQAKSSKNHVKRCPKMEFWIHCL